MHKVRRGPLAIGTERGSLPAVKERHGPSTGPRALAPRATDRVAGRRKSSTGRNGPPGQSRMGDSRGRWHSTQNPDALSGKRQTRLQRLFGSPMAMRLPYRAIGVNRKQPMSLAERLSGEAKLAVSHDPNRKSRGCGAVQLVRPSQRPWDAAMLSGCFHSRNRSKPESGHGHQFRGAKQLPINSGGEGDGRATDKGTARSGG